MRVVSRHPEHKYETRFVFAALVLGAAAALSCTGSSNNRSAAAAPKQTSLRFATGPRGGAFYPFGLALAERIGETAGAPHLDVQPSGGSAANLRAVQQDQADVALAFADVTYLAFIGRNSTPFDKLRAIAVLQLTPVQLIARKGSGIDTVNDLRGRRVSVGPEGSGMAVTARLILQAFGLPESDVKIEEHEFTESGERLMAGTLDAMFEMQPTESAGRALRAGSKLVPIAGAPVERLRSEYPFLRLAVTTDDAASDAPAISTVGVNILLLCRRDLSDEVVHDLVSRLFPALSWLSGSRHLTFAELDEAPAVPIPLHEGALRYYREQQLLQ